MLSRCYSISECTLSYHSLTTLLHTTHTLTHSHSHSHTLCVALTHIHIHIHTHTLISHTIPTRTHFLSVSLTRIHKGRQGRNSAHTWLLELDGSVVLFELRVAAMQVIEGKFKLVRIALHVCERLEVLRLSSSPYPRLPSALQWPSPLPAS